MISTDLQEQASSVVAWARIRGGPFHNHLRGTTSSVMQVMFEKLKLDDSGTRVRDFRGSKSEQRVIESCTKLGHNRSYDHDDVYLEMKRRNIS